MSQGYGQQTKMYGLGDGATWDDCLAWCQGLRFFSPSEGYTACEGSGMGEQVFQCTVYKNIVITGYTASDMFTCWDLSPGKFVKLTLDMI